MRSSLFRRSSAPLSRWRTGLADPVAGEGLPGLLTGRGLADRVYVQKHPVLVEARPARDGVIRSGGRSSREATGLDSLRRTHLCRLRAAHAEAIKVPGVRTPGAERAEGRFGGSPADVSPGRVERLVTERSPARETGDSSVRSGSGGSTG